MEIKYTIDNVPRTLYADEIECRIGTISAKGCSLLLYKDARVDMKILDETYGVGNWKRTHEVINGNLFCNIEIWNDRINQWVKKQDVGTESYTEKEKGEASDSFKRAGFNVGIGRELYTCPFIWITPKKEMKPYNTKEIVVDSKGQVKWETTEKEFYPYKQDGKGGLSYTTQTKFMIKDIGYNDKREIVKLVIVDQKGNIRFSLTPKDNQVGISQCVSPYDFEKMTEEQQSIIASLTPDLKDQLREFYKKDPMKLTRQEADTSIKSLRKKGLIKTKKEEEIETKEKAEVF